MISWLDANTRYTAFSEGWALYAENPLIARDTNVYEKEPFQKYGMLKWQVSPGKVFSFADICCCCCCVGFVFVSVLVICFTYPAVIFVLLFNRLLTLPAVFLFVYLFHFLLLLFSGDDERDESVSLITNRDLSFTVPTSRLSPILHRSRFGALYVSLLTQVCITKVSHEMKRFVISPTTRGIQVTSPRKKSPDIRVIQDKQLHT